jgi:hypothetical protein
MACAGPASDRLFNNEDGDHRGDFQRFAGGLFA